jgi:hypothetical protein
VYEKYCPNCGQKGDTHRINWHYLWHDIPHSIFHLDKGFFRTMLDLAKRPGEMIRNFLDGKRSTYFRPMMYLIITGSFAGLIYLNVPYTNALARDQETLTALQGIQEIRAKYMNVINIGLIPIYSFFAWLFYRKERNYVEIAIGHFFMIGQLNLFAIAALFFFLPIPSGLMSGINVLIALATFAYTVWTYRTMFESKSSGKRLANAFLLGVLQLLFGAIIVTGVGIAYAISKSPDGEIYINFGF